MRKPRGKLRPKQRDAAESVVTYARTLGISHLFVVSCGCWLAKFTTGGKVRGDCEQHRWRQLRYAVRPMRDDEIKHWPKTCACGYVDRLRDESRTAQRLGDDETWMRLRLLRLAHKEGGCK